MVYVKCLLAVLTLLVVSSFSCQKGAAGNRASQVSAAPKKPCIVPIKVRACVCVCQAMIVRKLDLPVGLPIFPDPETQILRYDFTGRGALSGHEAKPQHRPW
eukprot:3298988-Amphidinium_carterae.1